MASLREKIVTRLVSWLLFLAVSILVCVFVIAVRRAAAGDDRPRQITLMEAWAKASAEAAREADDHRNGRHLELARLGIARCLENKRTEMKLGHIPRTTRAEVLDQCIAHYVERERENLMITEKVLRGLDESLGRPRRSER